MEAGRTAVPTGLDAAGKEALELSDGFWKRGSQTGDEKAMPACLSEDSICPGRIFHQQGNGSISGRNLDEKQIKNCAGRKLICHGKDLRT